MKKKWMLSGGLLGLVLLFAPQQGQALSLTVDSATANVGDVFSINLHVADAVSLTSWQFDLAYNPADAWFVFFSNGSVGTFFKTSSGLVWCVRGGMNAEGY